jgi:hypothetical protein
MTAENRGGCARTPPVGRPFVKGQSGNPGGRPKLAELSKALRAQLVEPAPGAKAGGKTAAELIAAKLVAAAVAGKPWAIHEVWDRAEGKPRQELTGAKGEDLFPSESGSATLASMLEKLDVMKRAQKKG